MTTMITLYAFTGNHYHATETTLDSIADGSQPLDNVACATLGTDEKPLRSLITGIDYTCLAELWRNEWRLIRHMYDPC